MNPRARRTIARPKRFPSLSYGRYLSEDSSKKNVYGRHKRRHDEKIRAFARKLPDEAEQELGIFGI